MKIIVLWLVHGAVTSHGGDAPKWARDSGGGRVPRCRSPAPVPGPASALPSRLRFVPWGGSWGGPGHAAAGRRRWFRAPRKPLASGDAAPPGKELVSGAEMPSDLRHTCDEWPPGSAGRPRAARGSVPCPRRGRAVRRGAQSSSSSSLAVTAGNLSWILKHSTKKPRMERYRCCWRALLLK